MTIMEKFLNKSANKCSNQPTEISLLFRNPQCFLIIFPALLFYHQHKLSAIIIFLIFLIFFRNPDRFPVNISENNIYSPADGNIIGISTEPDNRTRIAIFLSVADVHVQYAPVFGTIMRSFYKKGEFNLAYILEKSDLNERLETDIITNENNDKITIFQIAGQLARRIESFVNVNDNVSPGCRLGMIKFGSRVDIIFPSKYKVLVKKNEHVTAGKTILAGL